MNTEFKAVFAVSDETSDGLSRAFASRVMDARSQATNIVVNVSRQAGMTREIAERSIKRAYGADEQTSAKIQMIRVIGNGFDFTGEGKERMSERPTVEELSKRIRRDIKYYNGLLPERVAIAWAGYLSALLEWGLLSVADHHTVHSLLPEVPNSPVYDIMVGRADIDL